MIDVLIGLAIGGTAGAVTSVPFAVKYVRESLSSKKMINSASSEPTNIRTFAELLNIKVECLGVEEHSNDDESLVVVEFTTLPKAFAQTGIGIVGAQAEWVHPHNNNKIRTTLLTVKDRVFSLDKESSHRIKIPVVQEGNFELSSIQLSIYEGGVSKTHKVKLAVRSQLFSFSDI